MQRLKLGHCHNAARLDAGRSDEREVRRILRFEIERTGYAGRAGCVEVCADTAT
jgi:hypothetical protein